MKPYYRLEGIEVDAIVRSAMARVPKAAKIDLRHYDGRRIARYIELMTDRERDISGDFLEVPGDEVRLAMEYICRTYPIETAWLPGGFQQDLDEVMMQRVITILQVVVLDHIR